MSVPSARVAIRLQKFLMANGCSDVELHDFFAHGVFAVTFAAHHAPTAKMFWQHCGEIVSSRLAEEVLEVVDRTCWENTGKVVQDDEDAAQRSASTSDQAASNIYSQRNSASVQEMEKDGDVMYG